MITIRLLGGAKKALGGKASIRFEIPSATVLEILNFLQSNSSEPQLLNPANLIVAINGVDSAALRGQEAVAKSGDTVTVVTVVHGGSPAIGETHFTIMGIRKLVGADAAGLLDRLRKDNPAIHLQAVRAEIIFGKEHAMRILLIVLEAKERRVMIANKVETELLLRLSGTDQISESISRAGLKRGSSACFVAFGDDPAAVKRFENLVKSNFEVDDSVLLPTQKKKTQLAKRIGIAGETTDDEFLDYLVESAAILVK